MEVDPFQWQLCSLQNCSFQDFFPCHAELAVVLTGLRVGVMRCHCHAREEAEPQVYVTPPEGCRGGVRERSD